MYSVLSHKCHVQQTEQGLPLSPTKSFSSVPVTEPRAGRSASRMDPHALSLLREAEKRQQAAGNVLPQAVA